MDYLLIEQLPSLLSAFRNGIREMASARPQLHINGLIIDNTDETENSLTDFVRNNNLDVVCINLNFPISQISNFHSPIDFMKFVKAHNPKIKIMVIIQNSTIYSIRSFVQKIDPDGIVEVTDVNQENIIGAFLETVEIGVFYSNTILQLLRMYSANQKIVEDRDYRILYELSLGTKNIDIPGKVFISSTTLTRRKNKLKEFFEVWGQSDGQLIQKAKKLRYI